MEPVRIIHQNYGGICSWYCSRTYFWRESNKAGKIGAPGKYIIAALTNKQK